MKSASSRRSFLRLLAAGSAATAATPAATLARVAAPKRKDAKPAARARSAGQPAAPGASPALAEELRKQKALVEQTLKAVRDYPLPPGSEPAFVFAPLRSRKKAGTP
jgi:hypothetical protein